MAERDGPPAPLEPIPDPHALHDLPWYGTDRTLPAQRFVPGLYPRDRLVLNDASGVELPTTPHALWTPEQWQTLEAYLRGVDLFNRWYFWEAHETWEPLWRTHHAKAPAAQFIQGLIALAAMLLKLHMHHTQAARRLFQAVCERLDPLRGVFMGLNVQELRGHLDRYMLSVEAGILPVLGPHTPRIHLADS